MSAERERPIQHFKDLKLGRQPMVEALAGAVIVPNDGDGSGNWRTRGVAFGVSGSPGCGKTSILNGLADCLRARSGNELVLVEFDARALSGRTDLISAFFGELRAKLKEYRKANHEASEVDSVIVALDNYVVPFISSVAKGERSHADELREIESSFQQITTRESDTLHKLKATLERQLNRASVPVIALIDEVDQIRPEDAEQIAQLVRTVMDFTSVSFVLSYDTERLIDLLGGGKLGRSVLAKMIQAQVEIPLPAAADLKEMLTGELAALTGNDDAATDDDVKSAIDCVVPGVISTPRDVRRLVGALQMLLDLSNANTGSSVGIATFPRLLVFAALDVAIPGFAARMARQQSGGADAEALAADVLAEYAQHPAFRAALETLAS